MSPENRSADHYLSPTLLLAYVWAYGFTVFSALVGLQATNIWPEWLAWPAVVFGFAAVFALVVGLRPLLLDLISDLDLREKMGVFLLQALLFMTPKLTMRHASLIDCLLVLLLPFTLLLLRREHFLRLYLANFLIVALSIFVAWQKQQAGFEWAVPLMIFLAGSLVADHFFLELDRYPNITAKPFWRPLLLGLGYGAGSLIGGGALYALTPKLALASRVDAGPATVEPMRPSQAISLDTMVRLAWDTVILMILIVAALALLQWLKRKFRRTEAVEDSSLGGGVMRMVRKVIRPAAKAFEVPRGFSPREQILRGYWAWCDELERFGLARAPVATPKEFARLVTAKDRSFASPVCELTQLFEWAKYDRRDLTRNQADSFFARSREVIDRMTDAAKARRDAFARPSEG